MIIDKPYSENRGNESFLVSQVTDEINHTQKEFFFSVPYEYNEYWVNELADAFVVAMLLPALVSGQNIKINAPISDILHYNMANSLIYLLLKVFKKGPMKVEPKQVIRINYNPQSVTTGFSGGVDSFSTVLQHFSDNCSKSLRITHLALFNVESYGNDFDTTHKHFNADLARAAKFANEIGLPLISVDSNISSAYTLKDIYHFSSRSSMCLGAAILSLQKLFKRYFIFSSGVIDDIRFVKHDQYYYGPLIFPLLSNDNPQIIVSNADMDRVEKTKYLMNNELVRKHLYICAAGIYNEKFATSFKKTTSPNCSECIKCTRTLLTLYILNCLNEYENRFDINKYKKIKSEVIINTISEKKIDHFSKEIYNLMSEKKFRLIKKFNGNYIGKDKNEGYKIRLVRLIYLVS